MNVGEGINKEEIVRKTKNNRKRNVFIIAAVLIILAIVTVFSYFVITNRIIDNSTYNMEELAKHDEQAILTSINNRWNTLNGIANNIKQKKCKDTEELLLELNSSKGLMDCLRITLIADNGDILSSNMSITNNKEILDRYKSSGDKFIYRRDYLEARLEGKSEVLILGIKITPFKVENRTYSYIVCRMDIDALQDELKIDSYDGQGYSSVIDQEGNYIVNIDKDHNENSRENFYKELTDDGLSGSDTVEDIKEKIKNEKSFFITHKKDNDTRIMTFTPLSDIDWYFVMSVPKSVFEKQSLSLIMIFVGLMVVVLLAAIMIVAILIQKRSKMLDIEIKHREKLSEALSLAEQANKAKTTFLNNMSHDIRTPMNSIIGFTALAITHIDNKERVKDYLTKISHSSNHLLSLINDVLDMSRIESGNVSIEENPENIAEILHNICNIIQADIHSKQLELFVDTINVTDENIYCDRLRLNQILLNLISNSMKFTKPGGTISIKISQKPVSREGYGKYEFRIKDTGIGMSKEFIKNIFEPFARERTSTVSRIQGTGLGMAITKNIVNMMGGTIEVNSEEGKGTEFIVNVEFKLQATHKEFEVIKELQELRALVIDDDLDTCQSVSRILRQLGMRSEWTMYGKEAVARTEEAIELGDRYEVYIIDWLMPDMNGIETARRIRKIVGDDAPIIILSAYDWGDIEEEAKNAGVTDFISKPLFASDLHHTLMKVCGKAEEPEKKEETVREDFKGKRILLAEDLELNREIATVILEEAGFTVESAKDGKEAYEMVKNSKPGWYDLILMDIQMPVMNGYDSTKAIRKLDNKKLADIPIIAMTADTFVEDQKIAMESGMNGHLGKPIDIALLMDTLADIFDKNQGEV